MLPAAGLTGFGPLPLICVSVVLWQVVVVQVAGAALTLFVLGAVPIKNWQTNGRIQLARHRFCGSGTLSVLLTLSPFTAINRTEKPSGTHNFMDILERSNYLINKW